MVWCICFIFAHCPYGTLKTPYQPLAGPCSHVAKPFLQEPSKMMDDSLKAQRPHKHQDPTCWLYGPNQGGFQKPWLVGSFCLGGLWGPYSK